MKKFSQMEVRVIKIFARQLEKRFLNIFRINLCPKHQQVNKLTSLIFVHLR